jgi:hypothetical protein
MADVWQELFGRPEQIKVKQPEVRAMADHQCIRIDEDNCRICRLEAELTHTRQALESAEKEAEVLRDALKKFELYFLSGNEQPVERAVIRANSEAVYAMLEALRPSSAREGKEPTA